MSSDTLRQRVIGASDAELSALLSFFSGCQIEQYYSGLIALVRAEQARRKRGTGPA